MVATTTCFPCNEFRAWVPAGATHPTRWQFFFPGPRRAPMAGLQAASRMARPEFLPATVWHVLQQRGCLVRANYSRTTASSYLKIYDHATNRTLELRDSDHGGYYHGGQIINLTSGRRRYHARALRQLCALLDHPLPRVGRGGRILEETL